MNRISLIHQKGALKSYFPNSFIKRKGENELIWEHTITPTPYSDAYKVRLHYVRDKGAKVYVLEPNPLKLAEGKTKLPHVYSTPKQQLCLYYPDGQEWNVGMYYVQTLIPWTSEWLMQYEIWVGTGIWHGGGIEHENEAEKQAIKKEEETDENKK